MSKTTSVMNALKAETLLQGSFVIEQVSKLKEGLRYETNGKLLSFDDYYLKLQEEISGLSKLVLETSIAPGTEDQYTRQLVAAMESILDKCDPLLTKILHFQSKLRNAQSSIQKLSTAFNAWYTLAASETLEEHSAKFPVNQLKDLASAEFNRLMENADVEIETLIAAVKVQVEQIKQYKKTQDEKFKLGKNQADVSWSSSLPKVGVDGGGPEISGHLLQTFVPEPEEEEVPEPRGVFVKHGDPAPVVCLPEDNRINSPSVVAIIEDEAVDIAPQVLDTVPVSADTFMTVLGAKPAPVKLVLDPAPKKIKQIAAKVSLDFRAPVDGETISTKDETTDKMHCGVCHRIIRIGQKMFQRSGDAETWFHADVNDCVNKAVSNQSSSDSLGLNHTVNTPTPDVPPPTVPLQVTSDVEDKGKNELSPLPIPSTIQSLPVDTILKTMEEANKSITPDTPIAPRRRLSFLDDTEEIV